MGFPMATNLRRKIPKESVLYVNDVDKAAVERFVKEMGEVGPVKALDTAKEITEASVKTVITPSDAGCHLLDRTERLSCKGCLPRRNHRCNRCQAWFRTQIVL